MRHALLSRIAAFGLAAILSAPALAIDWIAEIGTYKLEAASLFRLRDQLGPDLFKQLAAVRNQSFADAMELESALLQAAPDMNLEQLALLEDAARQNAGRIGIEERGDGFVTLYASGPNLPVETAFTTRSWLPAIPDIAAASGLSWTQNGTCVDLAQNAEPLLSICDPEVSDTRTSVTIHFDASEVYGLGQHFAHAGSTVANRINQNVDGTNAMTGFNGGANGNTLIPIAYFDAPQPFALLLDNRYPQDWKFGEKSVQISADDGIFDLHVITGKTLAGIRRRFIDLSGHPPVPPKAFFGFWLSEYGFDKWAELEDKLASLKPNGFPISGVLLDLQWFGGIRQNSVNSQMGSLTWDETAFPDPKAHIADLARRGIGTMLIEESYISSGLQSYTDLSERGFLIHDANGKSIDVGPGGYWWGRGSMIDWINPAAGAYWHDTRRVPLISDGVVGHWTDLGEPEMFNPAALYGETDESHLAVHNSYNLEWLQSIADGYARTNPNQRPFIMSRSGAMGMQALGAVMWSGDTGADFGSLAAQMAEQTHMMWSGIDYFGSDVGGFHRSALSSYPADVSHDDAMDELYSEWLAYSALFEIPVRAHTENLCNCKETAPDRIGDMDANRANLDLRYAMQPYYYSLAHRAWRGGEPLFPSLDYVFPDDPAAAGLGHEKLIGEYLLGAAFAEYGQQTVPVYLPEGDWFDFRSGDVMSHGREWIDAPVRNGGHIQLPLFARAGALVPMNEEGNLVQRAFGYGDSAFSIIDDDGVSNAYKYGEFSEIRVQMSGSRILVDQSAAGASRLSALEWVLPEGIANSPVKVNGQIATPTQTDFGFVVQLPDSEFVRVEIPVER